MARLGLRAEYGREQAESTAVYGQHTVEGGRLGQGDPKNMLDDNVEELLWAIVQAYESVRPLV